MKAVSAAHASFEALILRKLPEASFSVARVATLGSDADAMFANYFKSVELNSTFESRY